MASDAHQAQHDLLRPQRNHQALIDMERESVAKRSCDLMVHNLDYCLMFRAPMQRWDSHPLGSLVSRAIGL